MLSFVCMNLPIPFYSHGCLKRTYSILHSSWLQHKFRLLPLCTLRMPSTVMTHSCINSFVLMPVGLLNTRSGMWARVFHNGNLFCEGWDARCCYVLLLQHRACIFMCHIYVFMLDILMCRGLTFLLYILFMCHMCSLHIQCFYAHLEFALLGCACCNFSILCSRILSF